MMPVITWLLLMKHDNLATMEQVVRVTSSNDVLLGDLERVVFSSGMLLQIA